VISPNDDAETRSKKIRVQNENFDGLEKAKTDEITEINYLLDLFEGRISLSEIMNMDIPVLNKMREVKEKSKETVIKAMQQQKIKGA
jgi:hypothetical protein